MRLSRQLVCLLDQRVDHRFVIGAWYSNQHHVASMSFYQGRDLTVIAVNQQITLPVTRHGTILDRGRPFPHQRLLLLRVINPRSLLHVQHPPLYS
jgi:hypothetical protein